MGAVGNTYLTLTDLANRMVKGEPAKEIIEILNAQNEILEDIPWVECNDGAGHKTVIRTGIPEPTWRMLNYGVPNKKSTTAQVRDTTGMLENYSLVDQSLLEMSGDKQATLLSESLPFLEGMNQAFASALFYGNTSLEPKKFMGLAPRFSQLTGAENSQNVITGSGSANCTSVWLVVWGPNSAHGLYPKGSKAGLTQKHLGEDTVSDGNDGFYQADRTHFKWDCGFSLRDWRQVVRVANIDVSALKKDAATGADLVDLMTDAVERVQNLNLGKPVFYCNRTVRTYLRKQIRNAKNVQISMEQVAGKPVMTFDGIPVRRCDAILSTETAVA